MILILVIIILITGGVTSYKVSKYIDDNYWDPPEYYDMNGSVSVPHLVFITIITFTIAVTIGLIRYFVKGEGKRNDP